MAERQETSVMASIQDILRDAQSREEQEKAEAVRLAREEEQRRLDEIRRKQDEQEARIRAEEEERQRRVFEEQKRQAEIAALQEATVQRARMEADAQARLAEMAARQDHERQLKTLQHDKHKRRLQMIAVALGTFFFVGAIGGGIFVKNTLDEASRAKAKIAELQEQSDEATARQRRLQIELQNTKDPEQINRLQQQLGEQQQKLQQLNQQMQQEKKPGHVGPTGAAPAKPGTAPKPACNCSPGDPLCSCL